MKKQTKKVTKVTKKIVHVTDDPMHNKKAFALKHAPDLKPKNKHAK